MEKLNECVQLMSILHGKKLDKFDELNVVFTSFVKITSIRLGDKFVKRHIHLLTLLTIYFFKNLMVAFISLHICCPSKITVTC